MRKWLVVSGLCVMVVGAGTMALGATAATKPAATQGSSNDLLTAQEIRKLVDAEQYRDALKGLLRVLQLKGPAAGDYDTHEMLMLKAECLLQTHQNKAALDALQIASDNSTKDNNEEHGAEANAMILLIQKSPANMYTPKTALLKKPLPILDRALRKDAYQALFDDEFAVFKGKTKAAMATMNLALTLEAAKTAVGIRAVERVATGSNKQSEDVMTQLATHAVKMINTELEEFTQQAQRISTSAHTVLTHEATVTSGRGGGSALQEISYQRGLMGNDRQNLEEVIAQSEKIPPLCELMARALGQQQDALHVAAMKAKNVKHDAETTLNDNYTGFVHEQ